MPGWKWGARKVIKTILFETLVKRRKGETDRRRKPEFPVAPGTNRDASMPLRRMWEGSREMGERIAHPETIRPVEHSEEGFKRGIKEAGRSDRRKRNLLQMPKKQ